MTWQRAWSWQDVAAKEAKRKIWQPSKAAERRYAKQLKSVGNSVAALLGKGLSPDQTQAKLAAYAKTITPWAEQAATNMVRSVKRKGDQTWREAAARWGFDMRGLLARDITHAIDAKIQENIMLITSIPLDAANNVGTMAQQAVVTGVRAEELVEKIAAEGRIAQNRARVIAQTEISKTTTALTRARAEGVGSEGYIWRTTRDGSRRSSHAAMEGKFVRWDQPPTLDGMTGHAGEFPNCRCYPEPVVHEAGGSEVAPPINAL